MKWIASLAMVLAVFLTPGSSPANPFPEMAYFPEGEFLMGSPEGVGKRDEHPQHKVFLNAFYLDRFEVTGKDFQEFLEGNPKQHPTITGWYDRKVRPDMTHKPVIGLTWKRCRAYCQWKNKRLPTEAEWERAAAGVESRKYPWGNEPPNQERANFGRCCFIRKGEVLEEVNSRKAGKTPEGLHHMAGNIAEWVEDWYGSSFYKDSPYRNPKGPEKGKYHVIRGGAWNSLADYMRAARRYGTNDGKDFYGIGCRCARSAD